MKGAPDDVANACCGALLLARESKSRAGGVLVSSVRREFGRTVTNDAGVPDEILHPHLRRDPLYGQQRVYADKRHLKVCTDPSCRSDVHQREDLKADIRAEEQQRFARERRERGEA